MKQPMSLERMVAEWMADAAAGGASDQLVDQILTATARQRPQPRLLALLQEPPMRTQTRVLVGSPTHRRILAASLFLVAALAAAVVGAFLLRQPTASVEWQGFRGGPSHDGAGLLGPIGQPVPRWTIRGLGPVKNNIAVSRGIVVVPTEDGVLHGFAIADGTERWSYRPGTSMTGPVVDDVAAYVTDGDGFLRALDIETGGVRWVSASAIAGASAATLGDGAIFVGTADGRIIAVDASTGTPSWERQIAASDAALASPAFADGLVYGASLSDGLVALHAADGSEAWRQDLGVPVGTIVVADGVVYAGLSPDSEEGVLRTFDSVTGAPGWSIDEPLFSPSVAAPLAISGSNNGVISARDVETGAERWRFLTDGTNRPPAIADGIVYVAADGQRKIYALDASTGGQLWTFDVDGENQCCIAVAGGVVLAGTMNGTVYAIGGDGVPAVAHATTAASAAPTVSIAPSPAPPAVLPEPFAVLARFSAADLGLDRPLGLAVAPSGDIYVTDRSDRVTRLDRVGNIVQRWGGTGSAAGQFDFTPASAGENFHGDIAVGPDGFVYVSDSDNHRVQVFTPDGEFVREFGSFGSGPGQFAIPTELTADDDGNVYVADDSALRLTKFSKAGDVVWIVDGSTDPRLRGHGHSPSIDQFGRIVYSNDDNGIVVYLSLDGEVLDSFEGNGCAATVDEAGHVFVDSCGGGRVRVFDSEHRLIAASASDVINAPRFGPDGQVVALGTDGSVLFLKVDLLGA